MTEEEFERIKQAEKEHLRAKKRLKRTLEALKQRDEVQSVVQRMKQGAQRLLDETESLVDSLRRSVAQREARVELALDDEWREGDLHDDEEILREERAEALVQRMKAEEASSQPRPSPDPEKSDTEDPNVTGTDDAVRKGPEKTIGRMGDLRPDDAS